MGGRYPLCTLVSKKYTGHPSPGRGRSFKNPAKQFHWGGFQLKDSNYHRSGDIPNPPPPSPLFPPKSRLPGRLGTALGPPPQPRFPYRKGPRNPFFGPSYLGNPSVTDCQPKGSKRRASLARSASRFISNKGLQTFSAEAFSWNGATRALPPGAPPPAPPMSHNL